MVRDCRGRFVRARANKVRGRSLAWEAEVISLKEALSWVKEWRTEKCIFETDAKLLVDALQGTRGKSLFDTIVQECQEILKHFQEVLVVFVIRSANMIAHTLARAAYSLPGPQEWLQNAPEFIACNLILEEA